jgi:beta-glucosidase
MCVANGRPVVLLLFNAGPLDITWAKESSGVSAIVECFFPAQSAGEAIVRTLTQADGRPPVVPAGRLPNTWPANLNEVIYSTTRGWLILMS